MMMSIELFVTDDLTTLHGETDQLSRSERTCNAI